jgi:hypothetical protein
MYVSLLASNAGSKKKEWTVGEGGWWSIIKQRGWMKGRLAGDTPVGNTVVKLAMAAGYTVESLDGIRATGTASRRNAPPVRCGTSTGGTRTP